MTSWGHWPPAVWLVLDALAVYRLIRLAQRDTISQPARRWLHARFEGSLMELVTCAWCLSVWTATAVVLLTYFAPAVWSWPAALLAMSTVAGWLSDREL